MSNTVRVPEKQVGPRGKYMEIFLGPQMYLVDMLQPEADPLAIHRHNFNRAMYYGRPVTNAILRTWLRQGRDLAKSFK